MVAVLVVHDESTSMSVDRWHGTHLLPLEKTADKERIIDSMLFVLIVSVRT